MPNFGEAERHILSLFSIGNTFNLNGKTYTICNSGKPTCSAGEPKTDIYVKANSSVDEIEIKISYKKENADFLENKTSDERAQQLFGDNWSQIIRDSISTIKSDLYDKPLIYKNQGNHTVKGSITLGWKFEILNRKSGNLSGELSLSQSQIIDVYAGTNISPDKRNALVNGVQIIESGIANYIIVENSKIETTQDAINALITIDEYVNEHPKVYFACKALNYRTFEEKYDGDRPLAIYVDWKAKDGKLYGSIHYDTPLNQKGTAVYNQLKNALNKLSIKTTDDINITNVADPKIIHE